MYIMYIYIYMYINISIRTRMHAAVLSTEHIYADVYVYVHMTQIYTRKGICVHTYICKYKCICTKKSCTAQCCALFTAREHTYIHVYSYAYTIICTYICIDTYMHTHIYIYIYMYMYMFICTLIYTDTSMHTRVFMYLYVHVYPLTIHVRRSQETTYAHE